ncbi:unnamed protein product, partial [Urochloa humidicola]
YLQSFFLLSLSLNLLSARAGSGGTRADGAASYGGGGLQGGCSRPALTSAGGAARVRAPEAAGSASARRHVEAWLAGKGRGLPGAHEMHRSGPDLKLLAGGAEGAAKVQERKESVQPGSGWKIRGLLCLFFDSSFFFIPSFFSSVCIYICAYVIDVFCRDCIW